MVKKPTDFKDPVEIDLVDTFSELSTSEEAKKGDLAVIEESPALPPESKWKQAGRAVGKVARAAARRNPLGLLIDSIVNWPTDEEVKENIEKGTKDATQQLGKIIKNFTTARGSKYNLHEDNITQRIWRSPDKHHDKTTGVQPATKGFFIKPNEAYKLNPLQNNETSTELLPPITREGKNIARVRDTDTGEIVSEFEIFANPKVDLHPLEIYNSKSPKGSTANIHLGSKITEVTDIKGSENILDDITTLVKGMKGEPMTRREVLRGGKAAAQVIGTPKPKLITDKVDTPIPVDEYESNFVNNMADELFNIWNDNDKNVFRNIFFTNYSDQKPKDEDITSEDEKNFEEHWKESLYFETTPDKKEFVKGEDGVSREINTHKTRLIPDTRGEWDDMRGTWVWDYVDPPTSEEIKEAGRGYFSDWEHIIDEVYSGIDYEEADYTSPYSSVGEMHYQEGMKNAKEFEKYIRMLKDKFGLQRYEIYDLWNLGARRYLDK